MNRSSVILVLAALPSAAYLDTRPGVGAAPAIDGIWYASRSFGPAVRGTLDVTESHGHWTARIAHKTAPGGGGSWGGAGAGRVIEFNFGADAGRLELETSAAGGPSAAAWWVQPPDSYSSNGHATPVTLTPTMAGRWRGVVQPLDDRMTFYLPVTTNADGSHSAFLRNPERNFGLFNTVERLELSGSDVTLLGRPRGAEGKAEVVVARGTVDTARGVMTIALPNAGGSYTFARVGPGQATNFYPRGFPTVPYHYRPPPAENDGWPVDSLGAVGIARAQIEAFVQTLIDMPQTSVHASEIHGFLMSRHGKLVLEEYFHGFDRERLHDTRSAAKSVTATIAGAVVGQGGSSFSVTTPVYAAMNGGSFPEGLDSLKRLMTVEDLLTMSSGYFCDDNNPNAPGNEDVMQNQDSQPNWYRYTLDLPMAARPGSETVYCSVDANLVGGVLTHTTGRPVADLFRDLVAGPLGVREYALPLMPTSEAYMGGGMYFRPRDFMKLGQMMLNGGTWQGRRVVSTSWAERASAPIRTLQSFKYGYLWWVLDYPYSGKTLRAYSASGNGGQFVIVVPDLDLVICFWAGNYSDPVRFVPQRQMVPNGILPAVEAGR